MQIGRRLGGLALSIALAGCAGSSAAPPPTTVTPAAISGPSKVVSNHDAEELGGVIAIAVGIRLPRAEVVCVAGRIEDRVLQSAVTEGFYVLSAADQGDLVQSVARCASVSSQSQFGTLLVKSRQLTAKEAACVTKGFFDLMRTSKRAAQQAIHSIGAVDADVQEAVGSIARTCLPSDKVERFLADTATGASSTSTAVR